ncbi:MAG: TlpA family protein disulfide reductase [Candidatus Hydrogenedentes bacterium]|nr:TlpA family protein disulfide reductase [Candidatus Hydrogenedentota bacterium]
MDTCIQRTVTRRKIEDKMFAIRPFPLLALLCMGAVGLTAAVRLADAEAGQGKLGDPAPALSIQEWAKGGPVVLADGKGKTAYVVEFWATWCPPCRESIPHLTELQKKYKDKGLVVIGVTSEEASDVKPFVEAQGDKMDYVVAVDKDGETTAAYMDAFGEDGIPHAFIVSPEGKIVWHGHPLDGLDEAVEQFLPKQTGDSQSKA